MRISLRLRVLSLVALVNVGVFGAGLWFLTGHLIRERQAQLSEFAGELVKTIHTTISPEGELGVQQILQWPFWSEYADAIILDRNLGVAADGRIRPEGAFINPVGSAHRRAGFDMQAVLANLGEAIDGGRAVPGPRGLSLPIVDARGEIWGACWFQVGALVSPSAVFASLVPWFVGSTLLLTLGTFAFLRRFVLDPVATLAAGSRRVRAGDLAARLPEPDRTDELADLVRGFNAMIRDVEAFHERLEEEAARAADQARRAEAAAVRQRQLASMGELAAGIAHEINNPLGGLLGALEALRRGGLDESKRERYLSLLQDGLERMQATVSKMLRFTPREHGEQAFAPLDAARDAVALVELRAERAGIEVSVHEGEGGGCLVSGMRSELGQAVLNLLANALDALEERGGPGRIEVSCERRGDRLHLSVTDDGPGVGPEVLERVADPFFTTKEVGRGTGLGLALVSSVMEAHNGSVRFESEEGRGFRAELELAVREGGQR
ncbi:MAG: HAMP domain-containing sensor histidine kinase [Planctomycetota bacterium]|jgi:signal transduction histidine kinase|nr:HAMP domain-containing sensor histidine kinase [Planctomycetota bacterium]MDP6764175.1 HAMP domain-containing sensor histidine kinase [Planctomycetota bacterium]MDP6989646.1 HAMP domain-containing sensor histidine kinase [Planctomycetota bacterium]